MTYIARPTVVLKEYLQQEQNLKPRMEFDLGRLSMALEIITVIRTLEEELVPMLALSREETISVLTTLLRDQGLAESADEWYQQLSLWRQPSFAPSPLPVRDVETDEVLSAVPSSRLEALREALARGDSTDALPGNDQSLALPSVESEQELPLEVESMPSE